MDAERPKCRLETVISRGGRKAAVALTPLMSRLRLGEPSSWNDACSTASFAKTIPRFQIRLQR